MTFNGIERKTWVPQPYQNEGVKWLTSHPSAALFWKPGLGKTSTVFASFQNLRKRKLVKRMLIIAGLRVCQAVWRQEQSKWTNFDDITVDFAHGPGREAVLLDKSKEVVLLNYDGIVWAYKHIAEHPGLFDIVCFDELTRMKHPSTRRFKLMKPLLGNFKFRWGLTGTPVPNGLMDLFGQIFTLDGGARLGKFITHYRMTYFHQKPWDKWTWYPNEGAMDQITKALKNMVHYVDEKMWLKMPALHHIQLPVTLPAQALKEYKKFEKEAIIKLKDEVLTASTAAVLSLKLRQYASGSVYNSERETVVVHEVKIDVLEDLIEELNGSPLFVAVGFLHEVESIRRRLGKKIPYLGGGVSAKEMDKIIQQWNMGWIPVLLAHPTSVAHGLNLQAGGNNVCWYTMTFNQEEHVQFIRRVYRQGQEKKVTNYYITAKDTIDEYLVKVMSEKERVDHSLMRILKGYFAEK